MTIEEILIEAGFVKYQTPTFQSDYNDTSLPPFGGTSGEVFIKRYTPLGFEGMEVDFAIEIEDEALRVGVNDGTGIFYFAKVKTVEKAFSIFQAISENE